jgi:hypothetical protein
VRLPSAETFEMIFKKKNAAEEGFNYWTIKGVNYPMANEMASASFHLKVGDNLGAFLGNGLLG